MANGGKIDAPTWQQMLDDFDSASGDSSIHYLQAGKTRLRLTHEGDPRQFFTEVERTWQGQKRTRYMIKAIVFNGDEAAEKAVVMAKTVLRGILGLLAEGYELFGEDAHGLTIVRTGTGLDTAYTVMPSPKPVPIPEGVERITEDLTELAERVAARDAERSERGAQGGGGRRFDEEDEVEW